MKIESAEFGTFEVAEDKIVEFPLGLPGFENCKRFALAHAAGGEASVLQLQSADDPLVGFSVTTPDNFGINYQLELSDEESAMLQLAKPEDALVMVIVRKDETEGGSPASAGLRANFMAPLVINPGARRGLQKIIAKLGCDITLRAEG